MKGKERRTPGRAQTPAEAARIFDQHAPLGSPELQIKNRQRIKSLDIPMLRRIALHIVREELRVRKYELCFHFVDAPEIARLNQEFLQHSGSTDVITFDYGEPGQAQGGVRGEIFISIPDAVAQAREFETTWQSETVRYVIHGLLHLRGYDDLEPTARKVMKREENRLVRRIEQTFPAHEIGKNRLR